MSFFLMIFQPFVCTKSEITLVAFPSHSSRWWFLIMHHPFEFWNVIVYQLKYRLRGTTKAVVWIWIWNTHSSHWLWGSYKGRKISSLLWTKRHSLSIFLFKDGHIIITEGASIVIYRFIVHWESGRAASYCCLVHPSAPLELWGRTRILVHPMY